ncbi:hypothetical protein Tco_0915633, partial [Tanacetum coccineum]
LNLKSFKDKLPPNIEENLYFQRLGQYPTSVRMFDDLILFLAGLKPSWEFGQQRPAIIVGGKEMALRNFIYAEDDDDLAFLPKEPSPGFGIGSPSASVNTEPPKDVEEPEVQPVEVTADSGESPKADVFVVHPGSVAAHIRERKCKTMGGFSKPHVKRKLASRSSSSRAVRARNSASKDDAPFLSISDDDEGLPDCFELKDASACHFSAITPPAWKGYLDNQMDLELLDLHDHYYARQAVVDNAVNRIAREFLQVIEKMSGEADNPVVLDLQEKISSLTVDVKEHKGNLDRMMLESQKWAGYQVTLSTLESKVNSLEADKALLEAVEASLRKDVEKLKQDRKDVVSKIVPYAAMELVHSDELGRLVSTLVSSAITYERCRAYEQLDEFVADATALIEDLLSKKPPTLQKPAPSRTQMPMPSSHKATPSSTSSSNPMSPPTDLLDCPPIPVDFELAASLCGALILMCSVTGEKDCVTFNPLQMSANILSLKFCGGATQQIHGVKKDLLYRFPQISLYCGAWILIFLASFVSSGNNPLCRCLLSGLPEVGSPEILPLLQFPFPRLSVDLLAMLHILLHCSLFQTRSVKCKYTLYLWDLSTLAMLLIRLSWRLCRCRVSTYCLNMAPPLVFLSSRCP